MPRVAIAVDGDARGALRAGEVVRILASRGVAAEVVTLKDALDTGASAIGVAPAQSIDAHSAAALGKTAELAALARRPLILLAPPLQPPKTRKRRRADPVLEEAAALAHLQGCGAVLCRDPDAWLEAIVLVAVYGIPAGPRVAIVAPDNTWMNATAQALAAESAVLGSRVPSPARDASALGPADIALVDRDAMPSAPKRSGHVVLVPVAARAELLGEDRRPPLVGLRPALAAAVAVGHFGEREAHGLGPAEASDADELAPDLERFERQIAKLADRAGDHETKVLLASYEVPITRQAVATTASAATRLAKRAGYPVELKPWGPDVLPETEGCPVETGLTSAAQVRRAFARVTDSVDTDAAIVRETPPVGRELSVDIAQVGPLGPMVVVRIAGRSVPLAAPAPLRPTDAARLAAAVESSRAGEPEPDREALADLLRRASLMAARHDDVIVELHLHRVVVNADGATVVDCTADLVK
jgi:hypothetical protein